MVNRKSTPYNYTYHKYDEESKNNPMIQLQYNNKKIPHRANISLKVLQ